MAPWFTGLSELFVKLPLPKLLLVQHLEHLDARLEAAHMQGRFRLEVIPHAGHYIHEDRPEEVAEAIAKFLLQLKQQELETASRAYTGSEAAYAKIMEGRASPSSSPSSNPKRQRLQRLRGEYDSLKAAAEEEEAADEVRLHDLRLERLALKALLDRYRERPPKEELAERYESEIDQLSEELRQLQEENALLAYHAACDDEASPAPTPSASARTPRTTVGSAQRRSARQAGAAVGAVRVGPGRASPVQVKEQAKEVRQCEAQLMALRRRTRVNEWYLAQLKTQLQETGKLLQGRESCLKDLKERIDQAHADRRRLSGERVRTQQTLETERQETPGRLLVERV
eukprot:g23925.t1